MYGMEGHADTVKAVEEASELQQESGVSDAATAPAAGDSAPGENPSAEQEKPVKGRKPRARKAKAAAVPKKPKTSKQTRKPAKLETQEPTEGARDEDGSNENATEHDHSVRSERPEGSIDEPAADLFDAEATEAPEDEPESDRKEDHEEDIEELLGEDLDATLESDHRDLLREDVEAQSDREFIADYGETADAASDEDYRDSDVAERSDDEVSGLPAEPVKDTSDKGPEGATEAADRAPDNGTSESKPSGQPARKHSSLARPPVANYVRMEEPARSGAPSAAASTRKPAPPKRGMTWYKEMLEEQNQIRRQVEARIQARTFVTGRVTEITSDDNTPPQAGNKRKPSASSQPASKKPKAAGASDARTETRMEGVRRRNEEYFALANKKFTPGNRAQDKGEASKRKPQAELPGRGKQREE